MRDLSESCRLTCHWPTCTGRGDTTPRAHVCRFGTDTRAPDPCTVPGCSAPARLYPCGLRCEAHVRPSPTPPGSTGPRSDYQHPPYGQATTDPLGRDAWPISKQTRLPVRPKVAES